MTRPVRLILLAFVLALAVGIVAGAAPAGGGPAPGVLTGWDGMRAGDIRYVALPARGSTTVAAVRVDGGRILRYGSVRGTFGIPLVAYDGSTGGLSADGRTLVLATYAQPTPGAVTRFAVFSTRRLRLQRVLTLDGAWSFDALSPDGRTIYAIEYLGATPSAGYRVRAVSTSTGRLIGGAIVDKREADEDMRGSPVTRAESRDGGWAYTLYAKPNGTAFVHALDTRHRSAVCIDLPWRQVQRTIGRVRMALSEDGSSLVLRRAGGGDLAVVDTRSFAVRSLASP